MRTAEIVSQDIENEIESGLLVPGDRLDEQGLATRFSISRTPAREALQDLAAKGLIRIIPRQGAVILGLSPAMAAAMMEVLHLLEAQAASLAARRMSSKERQGLAAMHDEAEALVRDDDIEGYIDANRLFHEAIYAGARNPFLAEQIRMTRKRLRFHALSSIQRPGRVNASWHEHEAILKAILAGDDQAASRAMTAHCSHGGHAFADMIAALAHESSAA